MDIIQQSPSQSTHNSPLEESALWFLSQTFYSHVYNVGPVNVTAQTREKPWSPDDSFSGKFGRLKSRSYSSDYYSTFMLMVDDRHKSRIEDCKFYFISTPPLLRIERWNRRVTTIFSYIKPGTFHRLFGASNSAIGRKVWFNRLQPVLV